MQHMLGREMFSEESGISLKPAQALRIVVAVQNCGAKPTTAFFASDGKP